MKRIFLRLKQSLRNERGEITFFACFFVVGTVMLISFLLIFLDRGASEIASAYSLNEYAADIITGIILFFILGSEFFINYRLVWRGHHDGKEGK